MVTSPAKDFLFRTKFLCMSCFAKTFALNFNVNTSSLFQHSNRPYMFLKQRLYFKNSDLESLKLIERRTRALSYTYETTTIRTIISTKSFRSCHLRLLSTEIDRFETVKYYSCCLHILLLSILCNYEIHHERVFVMRSQT